MHNYFEKVLYINLAEQAEKNTEFLSAAYTESTFLSEHMVRFDAVNGRNLDLRIIEEDIITDNARKQILVGNQKLFGISMTYGALGCALSHMLIWQEYLYSDRPILVLEDDAAIKDNFDLKLETLVDHISNIEYDIVYLGLHDIPHLNKTQKFSDLLYIPKGLSCGTFGMIVSSAGRRKLLDTIFPMNVQIDSCISNKKDKLNIFACIDPLVKHSWKFGSRTQRKEGCLTNT